MSAAGMRHDLESEWMVIAHFWQYGAQDVSKLAGKSRCLIQNGPLRMFPLRSHRHARTVRAGRPEGLARFLTR